MAKKRPQRKTAKRRGAGTRGKPAGRAARKPGPATPRPRNGKAKARAAKPASRTREATPRKKTSGGNNKPVTRDTPPARREAPAFAQPPARNPGPSRAIPAASVEEHRARIQGELQATVGELRRIGLSNEVDVDPRGVAGAVVEEGDAAQASERADFSFARRERLALRITALTDALTRLDRNDYGRCENCGEEIEPGRLRALPEAKTCIRCQEELERSGPRVPA